MTRQNRNETCRSTPGMSRRSPVRKQRPPTREEL
jgi:hypothetical protein